MNDDPVRPLPEGITIKVPTKWWVAAVKVGHGILTVLLMLGFLTVSCQNLPSALTDNIPGLKSSAEPEPPNTDVGRAYEMVVRLEHLADRNADLAKELECAADYAQLEAENDFMVGRLAEIEAEHKRQIAIFIDELNAADERANDAEAALSDIRAALSPPGKGGE